MATTGNVLGKDILVYDGTDAISHSSSCSLSLNTAMIDIGDKDSGGWAKKLPDIKDWNISVDGMVAYDATHGFEELFDKWVAGTAITVKFSTEETGDIYFTGSCYIESITKDAPNGDKVTFSISLTGDGALTKATVA